ncbi:hypothetical protein Tco_0642975 [Tanacetum coccineum]
MASSKANQKKTKKACTALKHLGISAIKVRLALNASWRLMRTIGRISRQRIIGCLLDAIFELEETMVLDKPKLIHFLNNEHLRFDNEEPDFNLLHKPDEEEIEPLRKKPRSQNRPSSPACSSVPCSNNYASEMQKMVEPDFGAMDVLEPDKPKLIHFYRRRVSNRTKKVQHDFNLSDKEEIEAKSQDTSPAEMHKNDKRNEDEDENVTPCSSENVTPSEIDIVSSSNGEVKLALSICKPSHGFHIPSLDAVMKQLEEKYRENLQGLGVEFNLSDLLKEICECFVEQGNVSDGSNQSLVQTFENSNDSLQRGIRANLQGHLFVTVGEIVTNTRLFERNEQNTDEKHTYPVLLDADWSSGSFLEDEEARGPLFGCHVEDRELSGVAAISAGNDVEGDATSRTERFYHY